MIKRDWYGLYAESWQGEIVPEAFAHPAKFARGLIRQIYKHILSMGWVKPGDYIVDPFGGVGLGGVDAALNGLDWIGIELEEKFVKLGQENIVLWLDKYGPGVAVLDELRSRGKIDPYGSVTLLQGDSRNLAAAIAEAGGLVSSPPYAGCENTRDEKFWLKHLQDINRDPKTGGAKSLLGAYSDSPSNLGNLPEGSLDGAISSPPYSDGCQHTGGDDSNPEHIQGGKLYGVGLAGAISSPPYSESLASDDPDKRGGLFRDPKRRNDKTLTAEYGSSEGQLGAMPPGSLDAAISSPPYSELAMRGGGEKHDKVIDAMKDGYGSSDGQLGGMKEGDFDGVISSPAYINSVNQSDGANDSQARIERKQQAGIDITHKPNVGGPNSILNKPQTYGTTPGQLGAMPSGKYDESLYDAAVSSPPYEGIRQDGGGEYAKEGKGGFGAYTDEPVDYWHTQRDQNNIGNLKTGDTFWTAARQIVEQTYSVLKPGAVAVWVVKSFVRDKKRVDFPNQWRQLCEACGFETVEWIRAWLVEERGTQYDLFGNAQTKKVERKSFFRRLAESKGSPSIDYEVVIIQRKPLIQRKPEL